nr:hypothetical protein [Streptomyces sp. SAT1]
MTEPVRCTQAQPAWTARCAIRRGRNEDRDDHDDHDDHDENVFLR